MNILKNFPTEEKYHIEMSHLIMEHGKPIHQGTLWSCIRDIRNHEASMTRTIEHSKHTKNTLSTQSIQSTHTQSRHTKHTHTKHTQTAHKVH